MDVDQLSEAISALENAIGEFPKGVATLDDYKSTEEKISDLRYSLKLIKAKSRSLKARIQYSKLGWFYDFKKQLNQLIMYHIIGKDDELVNDDFYKTLYKLNLATTNYLINENSLLDAYHSKAVQNILYSQVNENDMSKENQE